MGAQTSCPVHPQKIDTCGNIYSKLRKRPVTVMIEESSAEYYRTAAGLTAFSHTARVHSPFEFVRDFVAPCPFFLLSPLLWGLASLAPFVQLRGPLQPLPKPPSFASFLLL